MHSFYVLITCTICVPDRSVWVSDSQQPFVEQPGMSPDVLYLKEKQPLVIPCRVTHPNVTTTLVRVSAKNINQMTICMSFNSSLRLMLCITFTSSKCIYTRKSHFILRCPIIPHLHSLHIITCPSFFHQGSHMHTMHCIVVSLSPYHLLHCSYLGSHYTACVSI